MRRVHFFKVRGQACGWRVRVQKWHGWKWQVQGWEGRFACAHTPRWNQNDASTALAAALSAFPSHIFTLDAIMAYPTRHRRVGEAEVGSPQSRWAGILCVCVCVGRELNKVWKREPVGRHVV